MLDMNTLLEEATATTHLSDYGDFPLLEGLEIFCRALNDEAKLSQKGAIHAKNEILTILTQRLQIEDFFKANPDTAEEQIVAPVMVTGLPRGGTTALSQMLSKDPNLRSIRRWEAEWPFPPPEAAQEDEDPRPRRMQERLADQLERTPEYRTQLQVEANDPTEHYCFLRLTFQSPHLAGFFNVPSYGEWVLSCDMVPAYRYVRRTLQMLQARKPTARWNLKHPHDLYFPAAVAQVFPDAIFVWNHRDPAKTVASTASLVITLRRSFTDVIDKREIGRLEVERNRLLVTRGMAYRQQPGAKTFFDIYNSDLIRDPVKTIEDLYVQIGLSFSDEYRIALARRNEQRPKGKFGDHRYVPGDFGIDAAAIDTAFCDYMREYGVPPAAAT